MENCIALKDPVCGMAVTYKSFHQSEHKGYRFYFCGATCKSRFVADPERYSGGVEAIAVLPEQAEPQSRLAGLRAWLLVLAALLALALVWFWVDSGGFRLAL